MKDTFEVHPVLTSVNGVVMPLQDAWEYDHK
jgi:hypothetical protein